MRKISTTVPTAPAQPNAPAMSAAAPVKAMPAPMPSGATTPPPMNQMKMADDQPEESRIPRGAIGGTLGGLAGLAATLPEVWRQRRYDVGGTDELNALARSDFRKSLGRAAGATLLSAALGVGLERLARGMRPIARQVHDVKPEAEKTADFREVIEKVLDAKDKYVGMPLIEAGQGFGAGFGAVFGSPINTVRVLPDLMRDRSNPLHQRAAGLAGSLAGLGTLGYGAYRGGKALYNALRPAGESEPEKTADFREVIEKVLDAKDKYVGLPLVEAGDVFGGGFGSGFGSPINTVRALPYLMRDRSNPLHLRAASLAGSLAGLGTLGYGAYRGGKALYNALRPEAPKPEAEKTAFNRSTVLRRKLGPFSRRETDAPEPKLALNRSTVFRRQLGPHTFHVEYPEDMSVGGVQSKYDYGYLPGRKGPDGDSLDFYIGHDPQGSIARFTKKLPGVEGVADHKYFAGFTPEQLKDYQERFPEYTHQPGAALTDRVDFKNWEELNKHLESLPKTGPITRLQETLGRRTPMKVK
jgi:hypothetical protein